MIANNHHGVIMENSPNTGNTLSSAQVPQNAASIILLRDNSAGQLETLLLRRNRNQSFMGGAFVFPGGRMDNADEDPELLDYISGVKQREVKAWLQEPDIPEARAMGLFITALRETFEEAGVLLAYKESGRIICLEDEEISGRFSAHRRELYNHKISLRELAQKENLKYALDMLVPCAHWVTPEAEKRRFDTRFFITRIPEGQKPEHDAVELTESRWITPGDALNEQKAGRLMLMPPTLMILTGLSEFSSAGEALEHAGSLAIRTILPQISMTADTICVKFPGDPEYSVEGLAGPCVDGTISRLVLENGVWRAVEKSEVIP